MELETKKLTLGRTMKNFNQNRVESSDLEISIEDTTLISQSISIPTANILYANTLPSNIFTTDKAQDMDLVVQADISDEASDIWNSIADKKEAIEADEMFQSFPIEMRPYFYFMTELMRIGQTSEEADAQWITVQKIIEKEIRPNLHILEEAYKDC